MRAAGFRKGGAGEKLAARRGLGHCFRQGKPKVSGHGDGVGQYCAAKAARRSVRIRVVLPPIPGEKMRDRDENRPLNAPGGRGESAAGPDGTPTVVRGIRSRSCGGIVNE